MTPQEIVMALRREWWTNHGHDFHALYGDDGEMQCGVCFHDFKREPLDALNNAVTAMRLARASEAGNSQATPEVRDV